MKKLLFILFFALLPLSAGARYHATPDYSDAGCIKHCGHGYFYDVDRSEMDKIVCSNYPHDCDEDCMVSMSYRDAPDDSRYLCIDVAIVKKSSKKKKIKKNKISCNEKCSFPDRPRNKMDDDCERLCGSCFYYDRQGDKLNGKERVCTKYQCDCGYDCTTGWDIRYLVKGTKYTCQEAIQNAPRYVRPGRYCESCDIQKFWK